MITGLPKQLVETIVAGERLAETPMGLKKGQSLSEAKGWKEMVDGVSPDRAPVVALMLENYRQWVNNLDETTKVLQVGNFDCLGMVA